MSRIVEASPQALEEAARLLRAGGVVSFPTETVYGLGALATDATSVQRVFAVKGRPADNPLIVHISDLEQIAALATGFDARAQNLAQRFWPGPLTLVLPRRDTVPDVVTAGLDTVALRMPDHPVALALLRLTGPLAAPSANRSGRPSPTRARHVLDDLGDAVDLVLDGGPCRVGVESTVLDLGEEVPVVLRPGGITVEELLDALGVLALHPTVDDPRQDTDARAPGMRHRHYSPRAELIVVEGETSAAAARARSIAGEIENTALIGVRIELAGLRGRSFDTVVEAARELFDTLRAFDQQRVRRIVVVGVPSDGLGRTFMNRLRKAATRIEAARVDQ